MSSVGSQVVHRGAAVDACSRSCALR